MEVHPRKITLDIEENKINDLQKKLRSLGYPFVTDELSPFENVGVKAKSFVSCAIGKMDS